MEAGGNYFNVWSQPSWASLKRIFLKPVMLFIISWNSTYSRTLAPLRATDASRSDCTRMSSAAVFASGAGRTSRALGKKDTKSE